MIDGGRILADLQTLCDLGPRPAGSEAARRQRLLVAEHFHRFGGSTWIHPIDAGDGRDLANVSASWGLGEGRRILIGTHGDTTPECPGPGANDGASGVAVLMEMARLLGDATDPVELVVFDAEEAPGPDDDPELLGSRAFAAKVGDPDTYELALILEMVGVPGVPIPREPYSLASAPAWVDRIWGMAAHLGAASFVDGVGPAVIDDHLPLIDRGIPAVLVAGVGDPRWHTVSDLPEHCVAATLADVARTIAAAILRRATGLGALPSGRVCEVEREQRR